jgi:hypothetical protein
MYYIISIEYWLDRVKSNDSNWDVYQKIAPGGDEAIGRIWPMSDGEVVSI